MKHNEYNLVVMATNSIGYICHLRVEKQMNLLNASGFVAHQTGQLRRSFQVHLLQTESPSANTSQQPNRNFLEVISSKSQLANYFSFCSLKNWVNVGYDFCVQGTLLICNLEFIALLPVASY